MPGIVVGVDGSGHSQRALEWAMKEAAAREAPLTVNAGKDADMLVVGSRGAGGFSRLVMGSVSSLVIQHATAR